MNKIINGWFSEINELWPGHCSSLEVEKILHQEKSKYQDILVLQTKHHGKVLVLDGIIQCSESDEFSYQEMIAFLPLCVHTNPVKVLVIGGGDGGVVRECHKHPSVEEIVLVEIDDRVIETSKRYLPKMAEGFRSSKLTIHVGDGFEYLEEHQKQFDVIITDSSDPIGPAIALFTENYFKLLKGALREGGVVCSQSGAAWLELESIKRRMDNYRKHFKNVKYATTSVPTYPTGQIGFVVASLKEDDVAEPKFEVGDKEVDDLELKYYNAEVHRASFVLPNFFKKVLY